MLAANQVVLLLVDINNDMKEDPALSVLGPVLDSTSLTNAKIQENLDKYPVVTVNLSGAMSIGALTVPEGKTLAFTGTDTVTMSDNWVVNGTVTLEGALNLGGKDLSGTGTVTGDKVYLGSSISGSVTVTFKSAELLANFIINGGSLTINGNVTAAEGSNFSITVNGTAKLDAGAVTGSIVNNSTVKGNVQVDSVTGSVTGTGETDIYKISADTTAYIVNK